MNLTININMDPRFTEAICFLASALGYPKETIAQTMKETAKSNDELNAEVRAKYNKPETTPKQPPKEWTRKDLMALSLKACEAGMKNDICRILKNYKTADGAIVKKLAELQEIDFEKYAKEINQLLLSKGMNQ